MPYRVQLTCTPSFAPLAGHVSHPSSRQHTLEWDRLLLSSNTSVLHATFRNTLALRLMVKAH